MNTGAALARRPRIFVLGAFLDRKPRPNCPYAASSARTISQMPVTPRRI